MAENLRSIWVMLSLNSNWAWEDSERTKVFAKYQGFRESFRADLIWSWGPKEGKIQANVFWRGKRNTNTKIL